MTINMSTFINYFKKLYNVREYKFKQGAVP